MAEQAPPASPPAGATPPAEAQTGLASPAEIERLLTFAWHRFNSYDGQSGRLKVRYRRIRQAIILVSWLTTFLAVMSAFAGIASNTALKQSLDIMLVALPVLSTILLAYATRFETGVAWVGYRIAAESIRRSIYELRVRGTLKAVRKSDLERLGSTLRETSSRLETMGVTTPMLTDPLDLESGRIAPNWVDNPDDSGYGPLTIEQYINWRLVPQTNWYRKRVKTDYRRARLYRAAILITAGAGTFLAAIGRGELVAVTVAGVTALVAWLGLMQHESSYGIYMRTIIKLEDTLGTFLIDFNPVAVETPAQKARALDFVTSAEAIFSEERELWRLSVLQGQESTEGALTQMVSTFRRGDASVDRLLSRAGAGSSTADAENEES